MLLHDRDGGRVFVSIFFFHVPAATAPADPVGSNVTRIAAIIPFDFAREVRANPQRVGYCTVKTSALVVPPLVQPTSPTFPLGVVTFTLTVPGPEITLLFSMICSS